jgi:hypothetical protein
MPQQMLVGADFPGRDTGIRSKSSIRPHPPANSDSCSTGLVTPELRRMFCRGELAVKDALSLRGRAVGV